MSNKEKKGKQKERSNYNLWQNSAYMISTAWKEQKNILWLCLAIAAATVFFSLTQLFVTPAILGAIEAEETAGRLIAVIMGFSAALMLLSAAKSYFFSCTVFKRIEVRLFIAGLIQNKILTMSFPNIENQDVRKKMDKAIMLVNNNAAATEAIWNTLTDLLINAAGFVICLSLLASLNPLLIVAVLAATAASFFISNYLNGWGYRNRNEESEYSRRMNYLSGKAQDYTLAKDILLFGMRGWLEDVYDSTLRLLRDFTVRGECVYLLGDAADVIFTFMRNGVVYGFLINAVLHGEMSAAQFVLYFNTVGVFTGGIGGILAGLAELRRQSLDISAVREFLDYPEPFLFEGGKPLAPDANALYQIQLRDVSFCYPEAQADTFHTLT